MSDQSSPLLPIAIGGAVVAGAFLYARGARANDDPPATEPKPTGPTPTPPQSDQSKPKEEPMPLPKATPPPTSPFAPGSCAVLASGEVVVRWIEHTVEPVVAPWLIDYNIGRSDHEAARAEVMALAQDAFDATVPEPCRSEDTPATRRLRVLLLCEVVLGLIMLGKVDEEPEDVIALCVDPTFDPWTHGWPSEDPKPPSWPHPVLPVPFPDAPPDAGAVQLNTRRLVTHEDMSSASLLRLVEGQQDGNPLPVNVQGWVVLVTHPDWPGLDDAQRALDHMARNNPGVMFALASYADTYEHFQQPADPDEVVAWVLAGASPDGLAFPEPIVPSGPGDVAPPTAEEWAKLVTYAGGRISAATAPRRMPQRFGEVLASELARLRQPTRRPARVGRPWRSRPPTARDRRPWVGG